jgi:hypothetical protein
MKIKNAPISIDDFTFKEGVSIYLLSHMHSGNQIK